MGKRFQDVNTRAGRTNVMDKKYGPLIWKDRPLALKAQESYQRTLAALHSCQMIANLTISTLGQKERTLRQQTKEKAVLLGRGQEMLLTHMLKPLRATLAGVGATHWRGRQETRPHTGLPRHVQISLKGVKDHHLAVNPLQELPSCC